MLQEYFEVAARHELMNKLARRRPEPAPETAQGAGALGPDASTEQPVVEPSRVVTASLRVHDFADGMGRVLAQSDFAKAAEQRFQKEALGLPTGMLAGAGKALAKNPSLIGAGVGAAGGALAGGPDHRLTGALGGAALGAAGGHAGVGIHAGMAQGKTLGEAASAYGKGVAGMKLPAAAPVAAAPAPAAASAAVAGGAGKLRPVRAAPAAEAGSVVSPAALARSTPSGWTGTVGSVEQVAARPTLVTPSPIGTRLARQAPAPIYAEAPKPAAGRLLPAPTEQASRLLPANTPMSPIGPRGNPNDLGGGGGVANRFVRNPEASGVVTPAPASAPRQLTSGAAPIQEIRQATQRVAPSVASPVSERAPLITQSPYDRAMAAHSAHLRPAGGVPVVPPREDYSAKATMERKRKKR